MVNIPEDHHKSIGCSPDRDESFFLDHMILDIILEFTGIYRMVEMPGPDSSEHWTINLKVVSSDPTLVEVFGLRPITRIPAVIHSEDISKGELLQLKLQYYRFFPFSA